MRFTRILVLPQPTVISACPSMTISCAPQTFVSAEVMTALAATDAMDEPTAEIDLAVIDLMAMMDAAAMDAVAMDVATDAMDAPTVAIGSVAMKAVAMDAAAMDAGTEAMDASMVLMEDSAAINSAAAMDAVDVVVGALPLLPKHVVRLEATMYPPMKTSSATQAIDTTATGWRTNLSTSMSFPQGQRVLPASPHHRPGVPLVLASPRHQLHAWLIGPA